MTKLMRYWFEPAPAARLAVLRVASGGYALWYIWTRRDLLSELARGDAALYDPVGVFDLLRVPIDPALFECIVWMTLLSGVLFVLGFAHRIVGPIFSVLLLTTMCYRNSWSMIYHMDNGLVVHVLILGVTRSADAFSLDAVRRRHNGRPSAEPDESYGWPIKLICAVTAAGYFLAGIAKITGPAGLGWALGTSLRDQIAVDTLRKEVLEGGGGWLAHALYRQIWLFTLFGVGTYIVELGAPVAVFNRRLGRVWALLTWSLQWGIFLIMGIQFRYQLSFLTFLSFFDCEKLLTAVRRLGPFPRTMSSVTP